MKQLKKMLSLLIAAIMFISNMTTISFAEEVYGIGSEEMLSLDSSKDFSTYDGLDNFSNQYDFDDFSVRISAPTELSATTGGITQYLPNPFLVTAYMNTSGAALSAVTMNVIALIPGEGLSAPTAELLSPPTESFGNVSAYEELSATWAFMADPVFVDTSIEIIMSIVSEESGEEFIQVSIQLPALEEGYRITFNPGQYAEDMPPLVVKPGLSMTDAPIPVWWGSPFYPMKFIGWYRDSGFTELVEFPFTPDEDIKLFARWVSLNSDISGYLSNGIKYVPYLHAIPRDQFADNAIFSIAPDSRPLPNGLRLDASTGEVLGVPMEIGDFEITVLVELDYGAYYADYKFLIKDISEQDETEYVDAGYEILEYVGNPDTSGETSYQLKTNYNQEDFVSRGPFNEFQKLWFNGDELVRNTDYTAAEGSTRLTIRSQTFESYGDGTHTISAEFRNASDEMKVATEVVRVETSTKPIPPTPENPSSGNSNNSSRSSGKTRSSASASIGEVSFDKNGGGDIVFTLSTGSYALQNLKNGENALVKNVDYTVNGNEVTIKAAYLSTLAVGKQTIVIDMSGGTEPSIVITIEDSNTMVPVTQPIILAPEPIISLIEIAASAVNGIVIAEVSPESFMEALGAATEQAKALGENMPIIIELALTGDEADAKDVSIYLSTEMIQAVANTENASLRLNVSGLGIITLHNKSLNSIIEHYGDRIGISISKNNNEVTVSVDSDGTVLQKIDGGIRVALPDLADGEVIILMKTDIGEEIVKKSVVESGDIYALIDGSGTVRVVNASKEFADVNPEDWFAEVVPFVNSRGLFVGVNDMEFAPDTPMTRGMFVTVLHRLENSEKLDSAEKFADVPSTQWYYESASWGAGAGIVSGDEDGLFGADNNITREQMALMIMKYAEYIGMDTFERGDISGFSDMVETSSWANDAIRWAAGIEIIQTDGGKLSPGSSVTRAEVASALMDFVNKLVK